MDNIEALRENLIAGKADGVRKNVEEALSLGLSAQTILNEGLVKAMDVVGKRFKANEIYVPEVLVAARAMHAGMDLLKPLFVKGGVKKIGKFVIGTVSGDLHDIGKNLVAVMMEGAGFEVVDLGVDVSSEKFVDAVREEKPTFLGMSALLTTTMLSMPKVIDTLKEAGLRDKVKVIIGGAPVSREFAKEIGADGYADDARSAVEIARELM
ncbi:MAG: corrinoid protein [candidate division WOR-3 bacterium]|nr:corrinoid protein [candidate division WOR-3 bacterium]